MIKGDNTKKKEIEYVKYKNKYLQTKNSNDEFNIIKFIHSQSLLTIKNNLFNNMKNDKYCDKFLGKGMLGEVIVPGISPIVIIKINNINITIPIVIKKANKNDEMMLNIKIINKKLYIYAYANITTEVIILSYINELWYSKISPHLPFMIGYSCCENNNETFVDKIITERHGLENNITINLDGFDENPMWHPKKNNDNSLIFTSNMATMHDLIKYIIIKNVNNKIVLPNNKKCDIIKLFDYLTISYIHTHYLLQKHNIIISDMHSHNIFIHWINANSYLGDTCLDNTKYINYQFGNKIIKIKTYGLLLKIGDVGTSIITPRKDVFIIGQAVDLEKNMHIIDQIIKPNYNVRWFLDIFKHNLPDNIYGKTIACKILSAYPYNEMVNYMPFSYKLLNDWLTPFEMLDKFDKYFIDKVDKHDNTLMVKD